MSRTRNRFLIALTVAAALASSGISGITSVSSPTETFAGACCAPK